MNATPKVYLPFAFMILISMADAILAAQMIIPNFGHIAQEQGSWCWAASDQMVRKYYGDNLNQCGIANIHLNRSDCCGTGYSSCNRPGTLSILKRPMEYNINTSKKFLSFLSFQVLIPQNLPVIYMYNNTDNSPGHMRPIYGYDTNGGGLLLLHEPHPYMAGGPTKWITHSEYVGDNNWGYYHGISYHSIYKIR